MKIEDANVLVTGSARRLGKQIALGFARAGANLVVHYASEDSEQEAEDTAAQAREMGRRTIVVRGDQSKPADVESMFAKVAAEFGHLDVLVNSAAVFGRGEFLDISADDWNKVLGINLNGPFFLTQAAARLMRSTGTQGAIINISDNSGLEGWANRPHHSVSKAGVIMLTRVAAQSLSKYGIRVNCVVPGPVLPPSDDSGSLEEIARNLPLGRIGSPKEIAQACIFLAENDFATGAVLRVDGGEGMSGGQL